MIIRADSVYIRCFYDQTPKSLTYLQPRTKHFSLAFSHMITLVQLGLL